MKANGRQRILGAAFLLFSKKGFDAVGIREIADRAGLSNPAMYQHFRSKQALGEAVYLACYQTQTDELNKRLRSDISAFEKLDAFINTAVHLHKQTPSPLLFLENMQCHFGMVARDAFGDQATTVRLNKWIIEGQGSGEIRDDIPASMLAGLVVGQITLWALQSQNKLAPTRGAAKIMKKLMRSALTSKNEARSYADK